MRLVVDGRDPAPIPEALLTFLNDLAVVVVVVTRTGSARRSVRGGRRIRTGVR
jgi:hypothetical protein